MNSQNIIWKTITGNGPLVAAAIHDGHAIRPELKEIMALTNEQRLREEDPYTGGWTEIAPTKITGTQSRFEVDLNRPREKAVYVKPEDAWGLNVWKSPPSAAVIEKSLDAYDAFYKEVYQILSDIEREYGYFIMYDLHSYNHRRDGANGNPADSIQNPEVNIGTGTMDRNRWAPVIDRFISDLRNYDYFSRNLDVRENIKFRGGNLSRWIHQNFPQTGCSISIEFKKFFMDEWSGEADQVQLNEIRKALQSTVPGVLEVLKTLKGKQ